jgi:ribosomal protein S19E (S16A)
VSNQPQLNELANDILQGLSPYYQEAMLRNYLAHGSPNSWFGVNPVRASAPSPYTLAMAQQRNPYSSAERQAEFLAGLAEQGLLTQSNGGYCLTDAGRSLIEGFFDSAHKVLDSVTPIDPADLDELSELLSRVVAATLAAAEPTEKAHLLDSRWPDPGPESAALTRIDQYVTDLARYRDDAHLAAWRPYGVSGPAWEALTYVWREQAGTAAELAEQLPNRGYDEAAYDGCLQELAGRGWLAEIGGRYQLTEAGRDVRQAAEAETDRLFNIGLSALGPAREERLWQLLDKLVGALPLAGRHQLWQAALDVATAIPAAARPAFRAAFRDYFGETGRTFFLLLMAQGLANKAGIPFTIDHYLMRFPYASPAGVQERLDEAAAAGYMTAQADGYAITDKGRQALATVNDAFYTALTEMETLPVEDLNRLVELLSKVVETSLAAGELVEKLPTKMMHHTHPPADRYGPLGRIDQLLDDLNAFRDDAHRAAWQPAHPGLDGRSWEAFTLVWRGQAKTAAELAEQRPNRGYDEAAYGQSLAELAGRDWLVETEEGYAVTATGQQVRQAAEALTDQYFFAPWDSLAGNEQGQLHNMLLRLKLKLEEMAPTET